MIEMNLQPRPFEMIKKGIKTIEMRLYDEKRKKIKVGDIIAFTNDKTKELLHVKVTNLFVYDSFESLYKNFTKQEIGYMDKEIANPTDMELYYPKEKQEKYGVLAIQINLI